MYQWLDISNSVNLVISKVLRLESTLADFVRIFEKPGIDKRLDRSEFVLNENQELDFYMINYFNLKNTKFSYLENLPDCRVLTGNNTDLPFEEKSTTNSINKSNFL